MTTTPLTKTPAAKHWPDTNSKLEKAGDYIIQREYPDLRGIAILWSWREPPHWDNDKPVGARARKLPTMWRDIYKVDFQIEVCKSIWNSMSREQRYRLLWHELRHCVVIRDEDGTILLDDAGRKRLTILPHDIVIETFEEEVKRWGVHPIDVHHSKLLAQRLTKTRAIMSRGKK